MTEELRERAENVLKSRDETVKRLYGEHVTKVLTTAANYFINHPVRDIVIVKVPYANKTFFAYLRKVAASKEWKFTVAPQSLLNLMVTRRVVISKEESGRYYREKITEEYRHVLSELVE